MALLATVFLQRSGDWSATVPGLDAILAGALVVIVHLWRRNALLSIAAGTATYMLIRQTGVLESGFWAELCLQPCASTLATSLESLSAAVRCFTTPLYSEL